MVANRLEAVIFDVDGTLADTERHGHRVAFNRAFRQLGLEDEWDEAAYKDLLKVTGGERRLTHYFVSYKGLSESEAKQLAAKIHPVKTELFLQVVNDDEIPPRPGVLRFLKDLHDEGLRLSVATTGTQAWVFPLVEKLCKRGGLPPFEEVVTGDQVVERKPHPEAFLLALERMGLTADQVVIVEDSRNGVMAARAARCVCLAVKGEYADAEALYDAQLVVDNFGEPGHPIKVLHNPLSVSAGEMLDVQVVRELYEKAITAPAQ